MSSTKRHADDLAPQPRTKRLRRYDGTLATSHIATATSKKRKADDDASSPEPVAKKVKKAVIDPQNTPRRIRPNPRVNKQSAEDNASKTMPPPTKTKTGARSRLSASPQVEQPIPGNAPVANMNCTTIDNISEVSTPPKKTKHTGEQPAVSPQEQQSIVLAAAPYTEDESRATNKALTTPQSTKAQMNSEKVLKQQQGAVHDNPSSASNKKRKVDDNASMAPKANKKQKVVEKFVKPKQNFFFSAWMAKPKITPPKTMVRTKLVMQLPEKVRKLIWENVIGKDDHYGNNIYDFKLSKAALKLALVSKMVKRDVYEIYGLRFGQGTWWIDLPLIPAKPWDAKPETFLTSCLPTLLWDKDLKKGRSKNVTFYVHVEDEHRPKYKPGKPDIEDVMSFTMAKPFSSSTRLPQKFQHCKLPLTFASTKMESGLIDNVFWPSCKRYGLSVREISIISHTYCDTVQHDRIRL